MPNIIAALGMGFISIMSVIGIDMAKNHIAPRSSATLGQLFHFSLTYTLP